MELIKLMLPVTYTKDNLYCYSGYFNRLGKEAEGIINLLEKNIEYIHSKSDSELKFDIDAIKLALVQRKLMVSFVLNTSTNTVVGISVYNVSNSGFHVGNPLVINILFVYTEIDGIADLLAYVTSRVGKIINADTMIFKTFRKGFDTLLQEYEPILTTSYYLEFVLNREVAPVGYSKHEGLMYE